MKVVCLSDTHNFGAEIAVPDGDLLIHAGDGTINGTDAEFTEFALWIRALPHRHKVLIAGNHDWLFQTRPEAARRMFDGVHYLQDSSIVIEGLKIYGSPWQPRFFDWAFNLNRGAAMAAKWEAIPEDTDILITHGPPQGILDRTPAGDLAGCEELRKRIDAIRPGLHVFGHIHLGYGVLESAGTVFVNASNCNEAYEPVNPPIVLRHSVIDGVSTFEPITDGRG